MTPNRDALPLELGPDVVQHLLPHRRPFRMVDRVTAYARGDEPALWAQRYISGNEAVFEGHFPEFQIWPGVYTQEGLAQTCNLLTVLQAMEHRFQEQGQTADDALEALRNLELGYRLHPGFRPEGLAPLVQDRRHPAELIGFAAAVELKYLAPVLAGRRLDYAVRQTHTLGDMLRFQVEAEVEGTPVARGTLTSRVGLPIPLPPTV